MKLQADFSVTQHRLNAQFGAFRDISDGGFEKGRWEQWSTFWDAYQDYGNRTNYGYAFYGWPEETFKPKYDLKPTDGQYMFCRSNIRDFEQCLEAAGIALDTSACTNAYRMFNSISASHAFDTAVPSLDLRKATNLGEMFAYADFPVVRKIILNDSGTQDVSTLFHGGMFSLIEIRFEGVIGSNFRPQWSPLLSGESVQSIIDHLKDLTGQAAKTLTFHADVGAKLTDAQKATISAKNWTLVY